MLPPNNLVLKKLQRDFFKSLEDGIPQRPLLSAIRTTQAFPAEERFGVYANAYRARLEDALREDFPETKRVLGEEKFSELASEYIASHPSQTVSLTDFGAKFPTFLKSKHVGVAAELAAFEWLLVESFYAEDDLDPNADLASSSPAVCIRLQTSCLLFESKFNLEELMEGASAITPKKSFFAIYRRNDEVHWAPINQERFRLLSQLKEPQPLSAYLEANHWALKTASKTKAFFEWCAERSLIVFSL